MKVVELSQAVSEELFVQREANVEMTRLKNFISIGQKRFYASLMTWAEKDWGV